MLSPTTLALEAPARACVNYLRKGRPGAFRVFAQGGRGTGLNRPQQAAIPKRSAKRPNGRINGMFHTYGVDTSNRGRASAKRALALLSVMTKVV
jgi:hypothetical protein